MSKLKTRAFIYQMLCFGILFMLIRYLLSQYTQIEDIWCSVIAFFVGTFLAPQFQAVKTKEGEKLFMKWIFIKGIREIG